MSKLTDDMRMFIVQALACFDPPSVVAEELKRTFGQEITRQSIEQYDPTKAAGKKIGRKWREVFDATRAAFLEEVASIGISHRNVRLRKLQRQVEINEQRGNSGMVAQLLEQAAKEMGGAYTNRRELTGRDGRDLPSSGPSRIEIVAAEFPSTVFQLPDNGRGNL